MIEGDHAEARITTGVRLHRTMQPVPAKAQPACRPVQAIARVRLAPGLARQMFEQHLRAIPAVRSAAHVIGDVDYELRLECRDLADLGMVLSTLRGCPGTEVASTALVLGDVAGLGRRARPIPDWGTVPRPHQTRSA